MAFIVFGCARVVRVVRHRWTVPLDPKRAAACTAIIVRPEEETPLRLETPQ